MIYFFQATDARVKIGFTSIAPIKRLKSLQSTHKTRLVQLGLMNGDRNVEKALHAKFGPYRIEGEWFVPHPDILAFIEQNTGDLDAISEAYTPAITPLGFTVYPDDDTLKRLDKMAGQQDRKRSPMAVIAMRRGLDVLEREAKAK